MDSRQRPWCMTLQIKATPQTLRTCSRTRKGAFSTMDVASELRTRNVRYIHHFSSTPRSRCLQVRIVTNSEHQSPSVRGLLPCPVAHSKLIVVSRTCLSLGHLCMRSTTVTFILFPYSCLPPHLPLVVFTLSRLSRVWPRYRS